MRKRLGEILLERGILDTDQLNSALAYHRQWGKRLGVSLVEKGFVAEGTITRVLSEVMQIPIVDLAKVIVEPQALKLVRVGLCEQYDVFPISIKKMNGKGNLFLAMVDPLNVAAIDEVAFRTGMIVRPAIAQISSLRAAIDRYYHNQPKEIPPLTFERKKRASAGDVEADSEMTIIRGGDERVVNSKGEVDVVDLTSIVDGMPIEEPAPNAEIPTAVPAYMPPPGYAPPAAAPQMPPQMQAHYPPSAFVGQPTGAYVVAMPQTNPGFMEPPNTAVQEVLAQEKAAMDGQLEALEKNFWALMRVLAKKGLITKEEFLAELKST